MTRSEVRRNLGLAQYGRRSQEEPIGVIRHAYFLRENALPIRAPCWNHSSVARDVYRMVSNGSAAAAV